MEGVIRNLVYHLLLIYKNYAKTSSVWTLFLFDINIVIETVTSKVNIVM